jgi:glucose-1-phosphate adenylyltransferase
LFEGVDVGRHAQIRRAIIDKGVKVPPGMKLGHDLEMDRRRGLTVTENGIVVVAKGDGLEHMGDGQG